MQCIINVLFCKKLRLKHITHDTVPVDHICHSTGQYTKSLVHSECATKSSVFIADDQVRQLISGRELCVRALGVATHSDDDCARLSKISKGVAKRAGFPRANHGVIGWVEKEYDRLPPEVGKRHPATVVDAEGNLRRGIADLKRFHG